MMNPDLNLLVGFALGVFVMGAVAKTQTRKKLCALTEVQTQIFQELKQGNMTPAEIAEAEEFFRDWAQAQVC